jgi:hypothetical protein
MSDSNPPSRWSDEFLDSMRLVADSETDELMADLFRSVNLAGLLELRSILERWEAPLTPNIPQSIREFLEKPVVFPDWVDQKKLDRASDMFVSYGPVTALMILLDGFPHTLTNPTEARAFFLGQVFNPTTIKNRMYQLPHFMISITQKGGLVQRRVPEPQEAVKKGLGIIAAQKLRLIHSGVRLRLQLPQKLPENNWDVAVCGLPINHEDLTAALLTLCFFTGDGMKKLGIEISPEDEDARLHLWKTIGFLLGLHEEMQPRDLEDARALHAIIRRRRTRKSPEGVAVAAELIRVMQSMLPRTHKSLPAALLRYNLDVETADMLEVPRPRFLIWVLNALSYFFVKERVFAKVARLISPPLVRWLINDKKTSRAGISEVPAALSQSSHGNH